MNSLNDKFQLWRKWTLYCSFGEIIGIAVAASSARQIWLYIGEPNTFAGVFETLLLITVAGSLEGLAVGYFQWKVLKNIFTDMTAKIWITPTVLVAALGWFLGMLPSTLINFDGQSSPAQLKPDLPLIWTVIVAGLMGLIVGAIFGFAQWFVLRRFAKKSWLWILGNVIGWAFALIWIFLVASVPNEETSLTTILILGGIGGLLSGLSVGAITGYFLIEIIHNK